MLTAAAKMFAETEVLVIDVPEGASRALCSYRPRRDQTHLICRWPGEVASSFSNRVMNVLDKIRRSAEVVALTLVIGDGSALGGVLPELGRDLAAALAPDASLTLVGLGTPDSEMVQSFEVLRQLVAPSVALDVWFGAG